MTSADQAQALAAHWREAVRQAPEDAGAHFHLALALQALARYDEANGSFREALRLRLRAGAQPGAPELPGPRVPVARTTLVCADCRNHELAIVALRRSMAQCKFERVQFFTNRSFDLPGVEVVVVPDIASIADYSRFMLKALGDYIETDYALVIQYDGYILNGRRWRAQFHDYDYLGAPWSRGGVGNGGFSLRSRRLLEACRDLPLDAPLQEDVILGRRCRPLLEKRGIRFAPEEVARRFSYERMRPTGGEFGFHGIFNLVERLSSGEALRLISSLEPGLLARNERWELLRWALRRGRLGLALEMIRRLA